MNFAYLYVQSTNSDIASLFTDSATCFKAEAYNGRFKTPSVFLNISPIYITFYSNTV